MCGVAGIVNLRQGRSAIDQKHLARMIGMLSHRGPDGTGFYNETNVGLAHSRLSIIDLNSGRQPITNEDGSVVVVFNGEIFNYLELRRDLERLGHAFYTQSDTEVIAHLYEEMGDDFPAALNGQFAIALRDRLNDRLVLARDRVGITPLFYTEDNGRLLFASEVKALLPAMSRTPSPNRAALDQIMTFWTPISPATPFEGVHELPPGTLLQVESGGSWRIRRYWDWCYGSEVDQTPLGDEEASEQVRDLLADAVRLRLRSDVPVGSYLSGGLDSSIIAAMVRDGSMAGMATFSIGFEQSDYDESRYQQIMADHLGTRHQGFRCRLGEIAAIFPDVVWHAEMPMLRTAPGPMQLLSGQARSHGYKVVLTGEGADEVFGGYDLFKETKIRRFWGRDPDSAMRAALLKRLYPYLDLSGAQSLSYLKRFFGRGLNQPESPWYSHIPRWTTTSQVKRFFSRGMQSSVSHDYSSLLPLLPPEFEGWHWFEKAQYLEVRTLMSGYLLCTQGDRMLMANGVEGRYPFLDHRLIELANRLKPRQKMRGLNEKYILKKAAGDLLPEAIVHRTKQPYRAPEAAPFLGERRPDYVRYLMDPVRLDKFGYFDASKVKLLEAKMAGGGRVSYIDNMAFVAILSTQLWHQLFVENATNSWIRSDQQGSGENYVH